MPQVQVSDGAMINYEVRPGLAPENILFIHGNLASNRWWTPAEAFWKRESTGTQWKGSLIYAEFRGCGGSSAPKSEADVQMDKFAEDFIALVRHLNLKNVHLVGHSTGGLIVALMLAKAPELFGKAILLDPVGAKGVTFDNSMIQAFEQMKADRNLTAVVLGSTILNNNPEAEFFKQDIVDDAYKAVKAVGHYVLKSLDGLDIRAQLKSVQNHTLVLHGEHDKLLSMDDSRAYSDLLPNCEFKVIPGQGHCTNLENPELFVRLVKNFLFPA